MSSCFYILVFLVFSDETMRQMAKLMMEADVGYIMGSEPNSTPTVIPRIVESRIEVDGIVLVETSDPVERLVCLSWASPYSICGSQERATPL